MPDYLVLMHDDATAPVDQHLWGPYLAKLRETGGFQGGSEIGAGACARKTGPQSGYTSRITGFIRVGAASLEAARALAVGNPVYEAGGTVEIRELPPSAGETPRDGVPSGTESLRPFLPAKDFDLSKAFYEALGFRKLLDSDVAIFEIGTSAFILQRYYQKEWAENCMMQMMVDELDAWWERIDALDLAKTFGVRPPQPPALQNWGLRIAYVFDPCGVLWHIGQRRAGVAAD